MEGAALLCKASSSTRQRNKLQHLDLLCHSTIYSPCKKARKEVHFSFSFNFFSVSYNNIHIKYSNLNFFCKWCARKWQGCFQLWYGIDILLLISPCLGHIYLEGPYGSASITHSFHRKELSCCGLCKDSQKIGLSIDYDFLSNEFPLCLNSLIKELSSLRRSQTPPCPPPTHSLIHTYIKYHFSSYSQKFHKWELDRPVFYFIFF